MIRKTQNQTQWRREKEKDRAEEIRENDRAVEGKTPNMPVTRRRNTQHLTAKKAKMFIWNF